MRARDKIRLMRKLIGRGKPADATDDDMLWIRSVSYIYCIREMRREGGIKQRLMGGLLAGLFGVRASAAPKLGDTADQSLLVAKWEAAARAKFVGATEYAVGSMERRVLEHGAMCYANCASELKADKWAALDVKGITYYVPIWN